MAESGDHARLDAVRGPRRFGADPESWPPCRSGPDHRKQELGHEHQKVSRSEAVFQLLAPDVAFHKVWIDGALPGELWHLGDQWSYEDDGVGEDQGSQNQLRKA